MTNWILDSGAMCLMKQQVSDFIQGSLEDMDKYIAVVYGHHVTAKQKEKVQIKCVTITDILSSQNFTACLWNQIYATAYFQL